MSSLSIRIPESLHRSLRKISEKDHVSMNQFIASAIAEKITALETEDYLSLRASRGDKDRFISVLNKVKDTDPDEFDCNNG
ncbi:MAG: toxin-antitoxin system HicB family antitoxin [Spirochaetales bacterium]|nr:toxin-antitoxin system HicB family antitoxin [Spirochaetales bacterium]